MHVVTGGAYNGKAKWVRDFYGLNETSNFQWISAYLGADLPKELSVMDQDVMILEGVEQWVLQWLDNENITDYRTYGRNVMQEWCNWTQGKSHRKLVVIGTDISKGIVPIDGKTRKWRDITGWFYQDLVALSSRVDLIWYGIQKRLK
ncbi:bifunctional adenosylcobinamide kinase/adenosylcobinamide-phosphate guanylyltransferase [Virgibacillus soli]|uniref:Bifunctional adenosylcobinamide kinase/adenosylcobinamide-phosphate guanylyltransferase n=1 Tax=Paracerasibacillus soli TaxID=480284 RepID=A0ABU5CMW4_9BACI|nr:bifunctional adenosylcobinamide kinase/adenosylcobinamide-phosphate guanylyltransferase [Virgibacillus soli]MDY0407694.1 bifunctional adenosylcobinamide kinase/adenosylcobinamide-phosphate guanylyltransferase [Virgibacillus soli]